jgi:predicted permease
MLATFWRDLRVGMRTHRKAPMMTAVAVGVLALGIAATSVSVSIVNAFFVRGLPIADSERFVHVYTQSAAGEPFPVSFPEYEDVRALTQVFDGAAAESPAPLILGSASSPERVWGELVSDDYFTVLGVPAAHGRVFTGAEDAVVLGDAFWRRRFGADRSVIGSTIDVEGRPLRVAGVAPPSFRGTIVGFSSDLWLPLSAVSTPAVGGTTRDDAESRVDRGYFVMAKLVPGAGVVQARAAVATLARRLGREFPATSEGLALTALTQSEGRFPTVRGSVFGFSMLTVAIAVMMTLIACANVAGILLVRAAARRAEVGVRLALGASRGRIVSQLLAESASMALAAGALGIAAAWQITRLLSANFQIGIAHGATASVDVTLDARVLAISALVTMTMAVLCGLTPAVESSRLDLVSALRGGRNDARSQSRSRRLLLSGQVEMSMVLLAGSGLFLKSLQQARQADLGFDPAGVVTAAVDIGSRRAPRVPGNPFWPNLLAEVRALPNTESAAMTWRLPLELGITRMAIAPEPFTVAQGQEWPETEFSTISGGYFSTVGIRLLEGRDFDQRDAPTSPKVLVINDVIAARFWPGQRATGRHLVTPDGERFEVVGVVSRSKYFSIGEPPTAYVYALLDQWAPRAMTIVARTHGDLGGYSASLLAAVRRLDPAVPVDVGLLSDRVRLALAPAAGSASAVASVGLLALALTAMGLFGAVAQTVSRRTYEIGVRRALGAPDRSIAGLVLAETFALIAWGTGVGLAGALAVSRPMQAVLYGVNAVDPSVFASAPLVLLGACVLGTWLPTRRALRISAAAALRHE